MPGDVTALFWDIGGVVLSNGWDEVTRERAVRKFSLDQQDLEARHAVAFPAYEKGQITFDEYMQRAVFWQPRPFSREEFQAFVFAQSTEKPEGRAVLDEVSASRRYLVAALNNEGLELNAYRIEKIPSAAQLLAVLYFVLPGNAQRPDEAIYRAALGVAQRQPGECIFIDDREENLEAPRRLGMRTIRFEEASQLREGACPARAYPPLRLRTLRIILIIA